MIHEPIFDDPNSLASLLQRARAKREARGRISDIELATIIDSHRERALPVDISEYLTQHFRGEIKGIKGPKLQSDADKDFRFGPAHNLYRRVLPIFEYLAKRQKRLPLKRRKTRSVSGSLNEPHTPSEWALDYALKNLPEECDLRTISGRSLLNAFSERQRKIEEVDFPDDKPNAHPTDEPSPGTSS